MSDVEFIFQPETIITGDAIVTINDLLDQMTKITIDSRLSSEYTRNSIYSFYFKFSNKTDETLSSSISTEKIKIIGNMLNPICELCLDAVELYKKLDKLDTWENPVSYGWECEYHKMKHTLLYQYVTDKIKLVKNHIDMRMRECIEFWGQELSVYDIIIESINVCPHQIIWFDITPVTKSNHDLNEIDKTINQLEESIRLLYEERMKRVKINRLTED